MRAMILLVSMAALSACNDDQASGNDSAAERNVTSEVAATNDTTAIDAATGEAADMAADVDFMPELENESDGNRAESRNAADTDTP